VFGIGNLIGGAAGTVDPCGRKTPVKPALPRRYQQFNLLNVSYMRDENTKAYTNCNV